MKLLSYLIIILVLPLLSYTCNEEPAIVENYAGFRPVDPIDYDFPIGFHERHQVSVEFSDIPDSLKIRLLPNETVQVSTIQVNNEGKITYGPAVASTKNSRYTILMDYMKFRTMNVMEVGIEEAANSHIISYARVGVGLRLVAQITTSESGINLGDLVSIGVAAKRGKITGSLSVNVLGVESKEVTSILPMPSEISNSTIQNAMQIMATIKSKIYDPHTRISPQIISIRPVDSNTKTDSLINETTHMLMQGGNNHIFRNDYDIERYVLTLKK